MDRSLTSESLTELHDLLRKLYQSVRAQLEGKEPVHGADLEQASISIARLLEQSELLEQALRLRRENDALLSVSRKLGTHLKIEILLRQILDVLYELFEYDAGGIFLIEPDNRKIIWETIRGYPENRVPLVRQKLDSGVMGSVIRINEPIVLEDVQSDPRYIEARTTTRSEIALPIRQDGMVIGCINLESDKPAAYHNHDLNLLNAFVQQASLALERGRRHQERIERKRLEEDLLIARQIQRSLFPATSLDYDEYRIVGENSTCEQVGGDYYDFFPLTDKDTGVVIADVTGKGIPAAIIMASVRAGIHLISQTEYSIQELMMRLNHFLYYSTEPEKFVTACYGVLDRETHCFTYVNAGHNPPLLKRAGGEVEALGVGGMLLGVMDSVSYEHQVVPLYPGDRILFYTDGITEAMATDGEEYGELRLRDFLQRNSAADGEKLIRRLMGEVREFAARGEEPDDMTVVLLERMAN